MVYLRKRLRSECDSVSDCTGSSCGRGEEQHGSELDVESARQAQLRLVREEHAASRLQLEGLLRASREQQGHVMTQLQELEGCTVASSDSDPGGGICVADLQKQLKAYAAQEQDAAAQLERLEHQHRAKLASLLAPPEPLGAEAAQPQSAAAGAGAGPSSQPAQQPSKLAQAAEPYDLPEVQSQQPADELVQQQQQQQQRGEEQWQQQQQQQQETQQQELRQALEQEAVRVDAEMARVALQQQLASSALEQRRNKKARTESISQVWEWLQGGPGTMQRRLSEQEEQQHHHARQLLPQEAASSL